MKNLKKTVFFSTILVIICFSILAIIGFNTRWGATITHHFKGIETTNFANDLGDEAKIMLTYKEMDEEQKRTTEMILKKRLNLIGLEENNIFFDEKNKIITITFPKSCTNKNFDYGDIAQYLSSPGVLEVFKTTKSEFDFLNQNKDSTPDKLLFKNESVEKSSFMYKRSMHMKNLVQMKEPVPAIKLKLSDEKYAVLEDLYKIAAQDRRKLFKIRKKIEESQNQIDRIKNKGKTENKEESAKEENKEEQLSEEERQNLKDFEKQLAEAEKEEKQTRENLTKNRIEFKMDNVVIFAGNILELFDENMNIMLTSRKLSGNDMLMAANKLLTENLPVPISIINLEANTPKLGVNFVENIAIFAVILAALFILLIAIRFRILAGLAALNIISQFCFILIGFTGLLSFLPGFCLTLPAVIGALFSIMIGFSCFYHIANKTVCRLNKNNNLELSLKQTYKIDVKPLVKLNIFMLFVFAIILGIFSPTPEMFSTLLIPLNMLLEANPQNSIFSFSYAMFFGTIGTLLFQLLTTKLILQSATDFKMFRNLKLYGGRINETKN